MSLGPRRFAASKAAVPVSRARAARWGVTKYSRSSMAAASPGDAPAWRASVTSLSGRTPVSIPQGGVSPVRAR